VKGVTSDVSCRVLNCLLFLIWYKNIFLHFRKLNEWFDATGYGCKIQICNDSKIRFLFIYLFSQSINHSIIIMNRGDRGYVGHFLVFRLSNVFKGEIRKNKSIEVFS
jgi:hypothetical protein